MSVENPQESVRNYLNSLSIEQRIFLFGIVNLNQKDLEISWDFDQVLMQTEIPVADYCDKDLGTHYKGRKITGWNSFAKWLLDDGFKETKEEADKYEDFIWQEPKIIKEAPPNEALQAFSFIAWRRGIKQTISTSRTEKLAETTYSQVKLHYPWLEGRVNQRKVDEPGISGEDFKAKMVAKLYTANPSIVHLDDSMTFARRLIGIAPEISFIGFPSLESEYKDLCATNKIFFPDISMFNDLIPYLPSRRDMIKP